jgi:hypothetical protein
LVDGAQLFACCPVVVNMHIVHGKLDFHFFLSVAGSGGPA